MQALQYATHHSGGVTDAAESGPPSVKAFQARSDSQGSDSGNVRALFAPSASASRAEQPLHAPGGSVQPHGALIALDAQGAVTHRSRNALELLPGLGRLGQALPYTLWDGDGQLHDAVEQALQDTVDGEDELPISLKLTLDARVFDVLVYAVGRQVLVEFEQRDANDAEAASLALKAHRSMNRLQKMQGIEAILSEATTTIRQLTGFDRVTACRLRHDDSAEVVAEASDQTLQALIGTVLLASDIPLQAHHLPAIHTLRVIANADERQVPIDAMVPGALPLDLSRSVLRSGTPVHLDHLKRLGVVACMTLPIVVEGRLWGVIACHHRSAHRVPHAARVTCDLLMQLVSSSILVTQEKAAVLRRSVAAGLRSRLVDVALHADNLLETFKPICVELQHSMNSDALLLMHRGQLEHDGLPPAAAMQLSGWLESLTDPLVVLDELSCLPPQLQTSLAPYRGLLAICFDRQRHGWMVLLRREHVMPAGAVSLTVVRQETPSGNQALPWDDVDRSLAHKLVDDLGRASMLRNRELEDTCSQLMAMLGHDLRDPLQTMAMVGWVLNRENPASPLGQRIATSTRRMQRLITQVLDMSRLRTGTGLSMSPVDCDMAALVRGWVDEARFAYPGLTIDLMCPPALRAHVDSDRLAQVFSNLVCNARHHGVVGEPIRIALTAQPGGLHLTVSNVASPLPSGLADLVFDPLKRTHVQTLRNPGGLGLGLYIAREVAKGHGGTLAYSHDGTHVIFTLELGPVSLAD